MPGTPVKIGPWPGGLNLRDDARHIADNELTECVNFDVQDDGTLYPRRPLKNSNALAAGSKTLLGHVYQGGIQWAIFALDNTALGQTEFYKTSDAKTLARTFSSYTYPGIYSSLVQYNGFIWVISSNSSGANFKSSVLEPPDLLVEPTGVPAMPFGDAAFMLKDRMFIVRNSTSRIYYSKATDPNIWADPDGGFFDVNPGDGLNITSVIVLNNQLIIFKENATYTFSYNADPKFDGTLTTVSPDQGALSAVAYNNEVYGVSDSTIFKFINGYFIDIAEKLDIVNTVKLHTDISATASLSVLNDILFVALTFSDALKNRYFAMNLTTGAWSEYTFPSNESGHLGTLVVPSSKSIICNSNAGTFIIFGHKSTANYLPYFSLNYDDKVVDVDSSGGFRYPGFRVKTKVFMFEMSAVWKRLYAWLVDIYPDIVPTGLAGDTAPSAFHSVFVNDSSIAISTTTLLMGKLNTIACRFKSIQFKWTAFKAPAETNANTKAPSVLSITAWINSKAPVSK